MIKLLNKRLSILQWALGYWVFVKDTNPNPDENYGAAWYRMNNDGIIFDEKNVAYDLESFGANEEYYSSEVEGIKL